MTQKNSDPPHGSRLRYIRDGCRCVGCCGFKDGNPPDELRWPLRFLKKRVSVEVLRDDYGFDKVADWKANGVPDFVADELTVRYHLWAGTVWPGWLEAGLSTYKTIEATQ